MRDRPPPDEIRRLDSREVYRNRWMTVREDRVVRADGVEGIYGVVEKPDFVVVAAIDGGRIHLVEQFRYAVGARHWELPQGALERDPTRTPEDVARSELCEETGLIAHTLHDAGGLCLAYGFCTQRYRVFLATGLEQRDRRLDPEEQGLVSRAFAVDAFEGMLRDGVIVDATTVAAFGLLRLQCRI